MTWFRARTQSSAVVEAERDTIWAVLTDPDLVARMTPLLRRIEVDGNHWRWVMSRIPGIGVVAAPAFTERMTFDEGRRIDFDHDPADGVRERAAAQGSYELTDDDGGTRVSIDLEVAVDLPLSRVVAPAVRTAMDRVIDRMGAAFSENLVRQLGG